MQGRMLFVKEAAVMKRLIQGFGPILVSTVDTDVIVILVSTYFHFCDVFHDVSTCIGFGHGIIASTLCQKLGK